MILISIQEIIAINRKRRRTPPDMIYIYVITEFLPSVDEWKSQLGVTSINILPEGTKRRSKKPTGDDANRSSLERAPLSSKRMQKAEPSAAIADADVVDAPSVLVDADADVIGYDASRSSLERAPLSSKKMQKAEPSAAVANADADVVDAPSVLVDADADVIDTPSASVSADADVVNTSSH